MTAHGTGFRTFLLTLGGAAAVLSASACSPHSTRVAALTKADAVDRLVEQCEDCPDDKALAAATRTPEQLTFVRRVNAIERALTGQPLASGNHVELLRDGPSTHKSQLEAIRGAKKHVHLITYILADDKVSHEYRDALVGRARDGVKVRFMWDAMGGRTISDAYYKSLVDAGIEVNVFGPIDPEQKEELSMSRRHHRKILVVDGRVAFTGGINITDEKRASSTGLSRAAGWRDTHVKIEGPAVAQFQQLFIDSWEHGRAKLRPTRDMFPKLARKGGSFVRAVTQDGNDVGDIAIEPISSLMRQGKEKREHAIYGSYVAAITNAQSRIWITQAYFIPNENFMRVLVDAAERGVDLRLLVPSVSDIPMMVYASRYHYARLLEAGARIWEYKAPVLHAKTAVVDGVWATVGSSNLDYRSFIHNDEANAIIIGADFGEEMERMFLDDLKQAREIKRDEWRKRSWMDRLRERSAVLFKYWI